MFASWVFYAAPLLWVTLIVAGFVPRTQRISALCLSLIALVSFLVIVTLSSTRVGIGELIFLVPCLIVVATSGWLFFRTVTPAG